LAGRAATPIAAAPEQVDVVLVCSSGGHLAQLLALREAWGDFTRVWVTENTDDAHSLLTDETVFYAFGPTHRNLANGVRRIAIAWLRNWVLAFRLIRKTRPRVVLTTGASTAVPFAWAGRLRGATIIYVESLTRIAQPSVSYRLIAPIANRVYVQWPELAMRLKKAHYAGSVLSAK
jgi:beta-1,4-N-acetylglucosaminyltransferase